MKKNELLALSWNDLDVKNKSLSINRYIGKTQDSLKKTFKKAPENKQRRIYLGDKAWKLLAHQYSVEFPGHKLNDTTIIPDSLIFHKESDKSNLTYESKKIMKKLRKESGVQALGLNYLRRYYSVAATKATNDILAVNRLMGYQTSDSLLPIEPYTKRIKVLHLDFISNILLYI